MIYVKNIIRFEPECEEPKGIELYTFLSAFDRCLLEDDDAEKMLGLTTAVIDELNATYPESEKWTLVISHWGFYIRIVGEDGRGVPGKEVFEVLLGTVTKQMSRVDIYRWAEKFIDTKGGSK